MSNSFVPSIALSFKTTAEACSAESYVNSLGIEDTEISIKGGAIKLIVRDITPQEYTKIATKYQLEKAVNSTVDVAGKALRGTTNAINYTATNVVAPVAKIAAGKHFVLFKTTKTVLLVNQNRPEMRKDSQSTKIWAFPMSITREDL